MAWQSIDVHGVVERGDTSTLIQYLKIGGDPNKHDPNYGATPVHWAAFHGMFDALTLLLDHGADLEARTNTGGTALAWGCMGGDVRVVRHMLDRGADLFAVNQGKGTALHHATHSGHPELVDILLKAGANPTARDSQNELPGESFDREVSDVDRRAITKALRKAKGEGQQTITKVVRVGADSGKKSRFYSKNRSTSTASIRVSRSKKKRSSSSKSRNRRDGQKKMESTSSFFNCDRSQGSMLASVQQFQSARFSSNGVLLLEEEGDNESVLAAKAALAAAAWSPKQLHLEQNGKGAENVDHRGSGSTSGEGLINEKTGSSTSGQKQTDFKENRDKYGNPLEAAEEAGTVEVDAELADLLRRTKDLNLAAEAAASRDVESRNALRKRMADVDKRALETVKAERERSEGLYALVQALEQRLREKEDQVRVLQAQLKACPRQLGNTAPCSIEEDIQRENDNGVVGGGEAVPRSISSHSHEASSTEREHTLTEAPPSAPTVEDSGSRVGKRAWWKKDRQEGTVKKQPPPTAAAVDQERSGKLFAMIGRK